MAFSRLSQTTSITVHKLQALSPKTTQSSQEAEVAYKKSALLIRECCQKIESQFMQRCDLSISVEWACYCVAQLIILRLWIALQFPHGSRRATRPTTAKGSILGSTVSMIELANQCDQDPRMIKWRWHCVGYMPWYAMAIVLAELCVQTRGPMVDRAWAIVDKVYDHWSTYVADTKKGSLWRPITKLHEKATAARLQFSAPSVRVPSTNYDSQSVELDSMFYQAALEGGTKLHDVAVANALGTLLPQSPPPPTTPSMEQSLAVDPITDPLIQDFNDPINWADWDQFLQNSHTGGAEANGMGEMLWTQDNLV